MLLTDASGKQEMGLESGRANFAPDSDPYSQETKNQFIYN